MQFAAPRKVVGEGGPGELASIYNEAAARYGLSLHGRFKDYGGQGGDLVSVMSGSCELTDLRTNEVIFMFELSGPISAAFDKLAASLGQYWGGPHENIDRQLPQQ